MTDTQPTRLAPPRAAEFFGDCARSYDDAYEHGGADTYALRSRMDAVVRLVGAGNGDALDAGMGPGRLCAELARLGWTISGVDASAEMVAAAREKLPAAGERMLVAPIERLPFGGESFDLVTATGVLEYSELPQALAEFVRVLRAGGRAVISYPNPDAWYGIWKTRLWYPAIRGAKRVLRRPHPNMPCGAGSIVPTVFVKTLRSAGFEVEALVYTSYLPVLTPIELLLPRLAVRLAEQAERHRTWSRRIATQVVYVARPHTESLAVEAK